MGTDQTDRIQARAIRRCVHAGAGEKLGIEPRIEVLPADTDLDAYVVSVNLTRRNLTVGQRAMVLATIYPEPARLRRAGSSLETKELDATRVSQARTVLKAMPEIAAAIIRGEAKLDAAYQQVLEMRRLSAVEPGADEAGERHAEHEDVGLQHDDDVGHGGIVPGLVAVHH